MRDERAGRLLYYYSFLDELLLQHENVNKSSTVDIRLSSRECFSHEQVPAKS